MSLLIDAYKNVKFVKGRFGEEDEVDWGNTPDPRNGKVDMKVAREDVAARVARAVYGKVDTCVESMDTGVIAALAALAKAETAEAEAVAKLDYMMSDEEYNMLDIDIFMCRKATKAAEVAVATAKTDAENACDLP